jgi:hypothetical protein
MEMKLFEKDPLHWNILTDMWFGAGVGQPDTEGHDST